MKICFNNKEVEQALIELNIQTVALAYVRVDDMEQNIARDLKAMQKFLNKTAYKAFRIYMLDEDIKNEVQDEEIGYIITNEGKRIDVYYDGNYYNSAYYTINED